MWSNHFSINGSTNWNDVIYDHVIFTKDSNFLITGNLRHPVTSYRVASAMKVSPTGDTLWTKSFGHSGSGYTEETYGIETLDSNYIVAWATALVYTLLKLIHKETLFGHELMKMLELESQEFSKVQIVCSM